MYTLDDTTLAPLDVTTLWMNLTAANDAWAPVWDLEYTARAAYALPDVGAASWARALGDWAVAGSDGWATFVAASQKQFAGTPACEGACKVAFIGWLNGSIVDD